MVSFKLKKVFNRSRSRASFPDLKLTRAAKKILEAGDFYGDNMVFKLDRKTKGSKKFRDSESDSLAAPSVHFEGQFDSLNGSPHLDVENEDMQHLAHNPFGYVCDQRVVQAASEAVGLSADLVRRLSLVSSRDTLPDEASDEEGPEFWQSESAADLEP